MNPADQDKRNVIRISITQHIRKRIKGSILGEVSALASEVEYEFASCR